MEALAITLGVIVLVALALWCGEIVVLNFIIIPAIHVMDEQEKAAFTGRYLPRFVNIATILALTIVFSGLGAWLAATFGLQTPSGIWGSPLLQIAAILIAMLASFHLVAQSILRRITKSFLSDSLHKKKLQFITRFLGTVPRIGLVVIISSFVLIMILSERI